MSYAKEYFGLYRAIVVDNKDPEKRGRVKVYCPSVLDEYTSNWCVPCKNLSGTSWEVPQLETAIWIMFEEGKVDKPVWVGGWWVANDYQPSVDVVKEQLENWDKMIVTPTKLPVKDLNGNLEDYFGYKTPFGGVYWKKDYPDPVDGHQDVAMQIDCNDWAKIKATEDNTPGAIVKKIEVITAGGTISITSDGVITLSGSTINITATGNVNITGANIP